MSVTKTVANKYKFEMGGGGTDLTATHRIILMAEGFTFDRAAHGTYSDVSASELTTDNGYTAQGEALTVSSAWAQDNVNNKASVSWTDQTWTAATGSIGPLISAIVLQWDAGTPANSLIVGEIHLGTAKTVTDGIKLIIEDIGFDLT